MIVVRDRGLRSVDEIAFSLVQNFLVYNSPRLGALFWCPAPRHCRPAKPAESARRGGSTLSGSQCAETKQAVDKLMHPGAGASTGSYRMPLAMAVRQKLTRLR